MTDLAEKNAYFTKSEKDGFNWDLFSQKLVLNTENISLGKLVINCSL